MEKLKVHRKNPHAVAPGRRGGKAGTGASKRRADAAVNARLGGLARWRKHRERQARRVSGKHSSC
jgi:hypothetical protein